MFVRSSTVTASGTKLLRKDESKETEVQPPQPPEDSQASAPDTHTVKREKSILSRPHLSLAFSDLSTSDIEDFQLAKITGTSQSPPRTTILRHARSASNLQSTRLSNEKWLYQQVIDHHLADDPNPVDFDNDEEYEDVFGRSEDKCDDTGC
jgi:hypothetical protein